VCVCVCVCVICYRKISSLPPDLGPGYTVPPPCPPPLGFARRPATCHARFLPRDAMIARYMLLSCVRLSAVCPSQVGSPIETTGRIELVFGMEASLYLSHTTCKEIRVLPSGTLFQTPDLENFATEVDGRACSPHLYDNRRVVAVYYKSINCNLLTPLLRFVVALLYNLFL